MKNLIIIALTSLPLIGIAQTNNNTVELTQLHTSILEETVILPFRAHAKLVPFI